jgi:hypothetical protein
MAQAKARKATRKAAKNSAKKPQRQAGRKISQQKAVEFMGWCMVESMGAMLDISKMLDCIPQEYIEKYAPELTKSAIQRLKRLKRLRKMLVAEHLS